VTSVLESRWPCERPSFTDDVQRPPAWGGVCMCVCPWNRTGAVQARVPACDGARRSRAQDVQVAGQRDRPAARDRGHHVGPAARHAAHGQPGREGGAEGGSGAEGGLPGRHPGVRHGRAALRACVIYVAGTRVRWSCGKLACFVPTLSSLRVGRCQARFADIVSWKSREYFPTVSSSSLERVSNRPIVCEDSSYFSFNGRRKVVSWHGDGDLC
jgi:hypothetical protein